MNTDAGVPPSEDKDEAMQDALRDSDAVRDSNAVRDSAAPFAYVDQHEDAVMGDISNSDSGSELDWNDYLEFKREDPDRFEGLEDPDYEPSQAGSEAGEWDGEESGSVSDKDDLQAAAGARTQGQQQANVHGGSVHHARRHDTRVLDSLILDAPGMAASLQAVLIPAPELEHDLLQLTTAAIQLLRQLPRQTLQYLPCSSPGISPHQTSSIRAH